MPDGVLIEQLSEGVDVALGEGVEASAVRSSLGWAMNSSIFSNGQRAYDLVIPLTMSHRYQWRRSERVRDSAKAAIRELPSALAP